jgi:hypothetical protein
VSGSHNGAIHQTRLNADDEVAVEETMTFSSARRVGGRGGVVMRSRERALMIGWGIGSAFVAMGWCVGCGDDGDGGGGDVTTGIAPSKLLSDVTPSEAAQACQRFQAGIEARLSRAELVRSACTLFGAAFADTAADCATQRDMCIQQADQAGSQTMMAIEMNEFELDCSEGASLECSSGTVGQLETCFNDMLDAARAALSGWSCDDAATLTMDDLENFGDQFAESPASCESIDCGEGGPFDMQ